MDKFIYFFIDNSAIINVVVFISILLAIAFYLIWKRCIDKNSQYSLKDLPYEVVKRPSGETWLLYKYVKNIETNKRDFIKNHFHQKSEFIDSNNNNYVISEVLGEAFYYDEVASDGKRYRLGPYVAFVIVPKSLCKNEIEIKDVYAPVQVATDNSIAYQSIENSTFLIRFQNCKDKMLENGISEQDINTVIKYYNDNHVRESFFSKYGLTLASIIVDIAGVAINLLDYLKNI